MIAFSLSYTEQIDSCQRWGARDKEINKGGHKVQTFSSKINKSWGCNGDLLILFFIFESYQESSF